MALYLLTSQECTAGAAYLHLTAINGPGTNYHYKLTRASDGLVLDNSIISRAQLPLDFDSVYDDQYQLVLVDADDPTNTGSATFTATCGYANPASGGGSLDQLQFDSLTHTDETGPGAHDGTVTAQVSNGTAPLTASLPALSRSQAVSAGQPFTFTGIPVGDNYVLVVTDSNNPAASVTGVFSIKAYSAPVTGCQDEYASNYDPLATTAGACSYAPRWRSAWQPMSVGVAAVAGQALAYTEADLRIGFRPGHPLAALRPLGPALKLRATVGPDGFAVFRLGPYLRSALGAPDGEGGYRLDINEHTVDEFYVGYELRRPTGEMLEQGYALDAAVPDAQLVTGAVLTAFSQVPIWPGYSWKRAQLASTSAGRYGAMDDVYPSAIYLPCPNNPLPVAWLNPQGGFDFWVFQGRPTVGDNVGEGQRYTEALTSQQRYSEPGAAYETYKASSGVFRGDALLKGLRTLWRSPQAWYQPVLGGDWVPILVERGSREVGRIGAHRNEVVLNFQVASPENAQGQ